MPELLGGSGLPEGLLDHLDIALQYTYDHQKRGDQFIEYGEHAATDFPLVFARDESEFFHFLQALSDQGLLEEPPKRDPARRTSFRLTPDGWLRLRELAATGHDSDRAFVAMSFAPDLKPAYTDGIKPALEALSYTPVRIDQTHDEDKIDNRIIAELRRSGLVVADFAGHRGGVYFEAGFALGLGIPVVWTCQQDDHDNTHFDTRQYQHLLWETPEDLKGKLVNHIAARVAARRLPENHD